ncbi:tRNA uridine-5-carboxymethylaminomethyl(34) synthesis GTPase MnmE [Rhodocytophaga aerolata]|uniref:tRNA modification GTPase MnmE n=2 Tax=Rhodocytophaga aerolata TaxID=455078 RepID=A0ABT8RC56_9BACT|nr:tRNA uridine-5-carboxymethylaminomethyl(34) synthesis GTPase MnmE [Rhodocytophaga aerolata]MDO1448914.1 tRNA uridine-5-carboxymethylaminomethyl(34) synthesis GTPase MnmE [Rhodocytophaga aerolata]
MADSIYITPTDDTIVAPATTPGTSAIAVIRISGKETFNMVNTLFKAKDLTKQATHTIHFGTLREGNTILDEVLVSIFKAPNSFTKEDVIEISCHGSDFIVRKIIQALLKQGARLARPGEFTKRAFLNGRFDLTQAEAVADLIHSDSEASHIAAIHQMRGGISNEIKNLREKLIHFASMIELELDFGEEDVEFADRADLQKLITEIQKVLSSLIESFDVGNAIKNGVPTVIAGKPNAGKSTLLNVLLNEDKAIVSAIPGTTRDAIEDEVMIEGVRFRIIDTAGLRETTDTVEAIGVSRTRDKMKQASLIIYLFDAATTNPYDLEKELQEIAQLNIPFIVVANKSDQLLPSSAIYQWPESSQLIYISAANKLNIEELKSRMLKEVKAEKFVTGNTLITNIRHYESLRQTYQALQTVLTSINTGLSGDLLALDIRSALYHLGEITGEITTDDLLATIFSKFCIGK